MRHHFTDLEQDILDFKRATDGKKVSRRAFASGLAALGLSPAVAALTPAAAKDPDLVLANWGGDAIKIALETSQGRSGGTGDDDGIGGHTRFPIPIPRTVHGR